MLWIHVFLTSFGFVLLAGFCPVVRGFTDDGLPLEGVFSFSEDFFGALRSFPFLFSLFSIDSFVALSPSVYKREKSNHY